ncbi:GNAT family N-acetyltransferase [Planococcus donghaensis]|uniref:GNAT family N-acetyltransferase n=1 Tax=Planococcus donghaensis TaxID=414778 RepID=A0A1C7EJ20_9BACL|nr:GNAT family N-acetyltransferase [Planococcus donghaensis]ANU24043.1 GNAT family N-acetyltransferase [Planococcus donghaensis]
MLIREAKRYEVHLLKEQRFIAYKTFKEELSPTHWDRLKSSLVSAHNLQPGVEVFVAEIGWDIVGSVALYHANPNTYAADSEILTSPEIRLLAVTPEFRSRGVGKALVEHCIDISKIRKQQSIKLQTGCYMKNAIDLYEKMGFKHISSLDFKPLNDDITIKAFRFDI